MQRLNSKKFVLTKKIGVITKKTFAGDKSVYDNFILSEWIFENTNL